MKAWEWLGHQFNTYVIWRFELDPDGDQLCMYADGTWEVRGYNADEENDLWKEHHVR